MRNSLVQKSGIIILLSIAVGITAAEETGEVGISTAEQYVSQMQHAYEKVDGYTCIFLKQERVDGELLPQETILLKFRKPFSIYMKWIEEPNKGQEVLYRRGWNDGDLRAHPGSFPDITVNLDPTGGLAMRGNRHPVTEAGIGYTIRIVADIVERAATHQEDSVRFYNRGITEVKGRTARCFEAVMPPADDSPYYAHRAVICIDQKLDLPSHVRIFDKSNTLIEEYFYIDIRINPGLADEDFSPENPDYNF